MTPKSCNCPSSCPLPLRVASGEKGELSHKRGPCPGKGPPSFLQEDHTPLHCSGAYFGHFIFASSGDRVVTLTFTMGVLDLPHRPPVFSVQNITSLWLQLLPAFCLSHRTQDTQMFLQPQPLLKVATPSKLKQDINTFVLMSYLWFLFVCFLTPPPQKRQV